MSTIHKVTAIVGSTSSPSRTRVLVDAIVQSLQTNRPIEVTWIELAELAPHIGTATTLDALTPEGKAALQAIEDADLLIAASPVYKGSYTGLFKHLIDFIHPEALVGGFGGRRPRQQMSLRSHDREAAVQAVPLSSREPLSAVLRAAAVQVSSSGWTECQLANANNLIELPSNTQVSFSAYVPGCQG